MLTFQTAVNLGDVISVRPGLIHPQRIFLGLSVVSLDGCIAPDGFNKCYEGGMPIELPEIPIVPTAEISSPSLLSVCDDLVLSGKRSIGGGIYPLQYAWNVTVDPTISGPGMPHRISLSEQAIPHLRQVLEASPPDASSVRLAFSLIPPTASFEFSLVTPTRCVSNRHSTKEANATAAPHSL